jgi:prepilin-type N-terminal cleavage/methylation domain-containing protein
MSKGFTLIELIIIIVVLGILAGVVIPKYYDMRSQAMVSTLKAFGATLKEAESIYLARTVLDGSRRNPPVQSFWDFVAYSEGASDRNTIAITNSIRSLLTNPSAEVVSLDGLTITLNLRGGGIATYRMDRTTGAITESYTGL